MNAIPITLTLYYPTMSQVEAYAGFMAMISIALGIFMLSLPIWHWSAHTTINKRKPFFIYAIICANPMGAIAIVAYSFLTTKHLDDAIGWMVFVAPLLLVYAF